MPRPARRRRIDAPAMKKLGTFLRHLARTGSVAFAAERVGLSRNTLYRRRRTDPVFAAGWADAIGSAVDRLHGEAMRRSVSGSGRAAFRHGRRLSAIRDYDSGLLIRLLRLHWPATYGRALRHD
ncbi:helix-turn-helix domain-containing protein [Reyranella sp.]|uniref:helix-turn-helix domain-containing protein n=1 Tax=Reyranella sp. TaxID=1929291 RepID=UPI00272F1BDB|nr:helix-turn-helix domain-containing protein [Reyranella sp.]MDP2372300.1 helix-turn-helix domain-containing protein [Reyranella sp.]